MHCIQPRLIGLNVVSLGGLFGSLSEVSLMGISPVPNEQVSSSQKEIGTRQSSSWQLQLKGCIFNGPQRLNSPPTLRDGFSRSAPLAGQHGELACSHFGCN